MNLPFAALLVWTLYGAGQGNGRMHVEDTADLKTCYMRLAELINQRASGYGSVSVEGYCVKADQ